jgi:DNA (cytosine-5)-methyltransferase 1
MKSKNEKTHLDLFSGIGGFALAAKWNGYRTVGFCDNEPYAQAVLKKHWPEVPCHKDIREVRGELYAGVTLLTGGFPCQPFSVAGKQGGKNDDRYLWPEMLRVIREARPAWIIGENVAGILNLALDQVCADLEGQGYEVEPIIVPACAVDAPHRRDRCWIIAKYMADSVSLSEKSAHGSKEWGCVRGRQDEDISQRNEVGSNSSDSRENVADSVKQGWEGRVHRRKDAGRKSVDGYSGCSGTTHGQSGEAVWLTEPSVGRVANGIPNRTHRLKGLGNAIVPQVASEIIRCINKVMEDNK